MRLNKSKNLQGKVFPYLLLSPTMLILVVMGMAPLVYAIVLSLRSFIITQPDSNKFVGLLNYIEIFKDIKFWEALKRTLYYVSTTVVISFLLGLIIALLINRIKKAKFIYRSILIIPMVLPPIVVGFAFRFMYNYDFGIINSFINSIGLEKIPFLANPNLSLFSVVISDIWQWTPFMTLIFLAGLEVVPQELYESAKIDGATNNKIFFHITLPFIKPLISIGLLIRIMDAFREFDKIFIMTRGGPGESSETLSLYIWKNGLSFFNISYATAMAIILLIFILILSQIFVKFLSKGEIY